ncbi:MAG TPA: tetratricopeptide repeat protein [Candidatus Angelobacter sp.]
MALQAAFSTKRHAFLVVVVLIMFALSAPLLLAQQVGAIVDGQITEEGKPKEKAQVVLLDPSTGRTYKGKTDKEGKFSLVGVAFGAYKFQVLNDKGEVIASQDTTIGSEISTSRQILTIDVAKDAPPIKSAKPGEKAPKLTKEQIKAEQEKVAAMNALIQQAQAALQTQRWADAEKALAQVITENPATTKWELYKALADSQRNQNELDAAAQTYEKGIAVATAVASGQAAPDPRNPNPDPSRAKTGAGQMFNSLASIYVKQSKMDQAIATYQKAAATDPNPAAAYYNLCALAFNAKKYDDAAAACDKSVAADPGKADAWFFKGAALAKANKPGAAEALNKYLQLDANGIHAAEAKTLQATAK